VGRQGQEGAPGVEGVPGKDGVPGVLVSLQLQPHSINSKCNLRAGKPKGNVEEMDVVQLQISQSPYTQRGV